MELNPVVIIPTFWTKPASTSARANARARTSAPDPSAVTFEHPTALDDENPPLARCLDSLDKVKGLRRIILVVGATDHSIEARVDERVRHIADAYPNLDIFVMGPTEKGSLYRRLEQLELEDMIAGLDIASYGAVRNLGLIAAAIHGHDAVVFIDDDEVVEDAEFLEIGLFGLGKPIHSGGYLFAKSGFYVDAAGRWQHSNPLHWTDIFWRQDDAFNKALSLVIQPPRLQRARMAFGGCLAIHREMYTKIAFDPWVKRGEDSDYVINVRLHGGDIYIDDNWKVCDMPPADRSEANRFRQDVSRFVYEHRKLEFAKSQVDLNQVTPKSLMPFPGGFVDSSIAWRAFATGMLRAIGGPERKAYFEAGLHAVQEASDYARAHCANYFALQRAWGFMLERLWEDVPLASQYKGERVIDRSALTGQFKSV